MPRQRKQSRLSLRLDNIGVWRLHGAGSTGAGRPVRIVGNEVEDISPIAENPSPAEQELGA